MKDTLIYILFFIFGIIVTLILCASIDGIVTIQGEKSNIMTVEYKEKVYRLELLK